MRQHKAESVSGNTQYPKIHTLWKKDIDPPSNWALSVTAAAPHQTMTKTAANTNDAESPGAVILKIVDKVKQTSNGPHKSPEIRFSNNSKPTNFHIKYIKTHNPSISEWHFVDSRLPKAVRPLLICLLPDSNLASVKCTPMRFWQRRFSWKSKCYNCCYDWLIQSCRCSIFQLILMSHIAVF